MDKVNNNRSDIDAIAEEEDIAKKEEELQMELSMATLRCQELHKTLQETKSFLHATGWYIYALICHM